MSVGVCVCVCVYVCIDANKEGLGGGGGGKKCMKFYGMVKKKKNRQEAHQA